MPDVPRLEQDLPAVNLSVEKNEAGWVRANSDLRRSDERSSWMSSADGWHRGR